MAGNFSSLIGQVDDGIEQRSSLVAALRSKLGSLSDVADIAAPPAAEPAVAAPAEPTPLQGAERAASLEISKQPEPATLILGAPGGADSFTDVMAQLDRGMDSRQKLIDALKSQLGRSAALPKGAPQAPPTPSHGGAARPPAAAGPGAAEAPPWGGRRASQASAPIPLSTPISATPTFNTMQPGSFAEPAAKRPRVSETAPGFPAAYGDPAQDALAARKAEMLRSLQAAESSSGMPFAGQAAMPPGGAGPPGMAPKAGAPGFRPPAPPAPPANATKEEFEAYRQQCWKQYYEYCSVWQKYYDQNKQGATPAAKAAHSKAKGAPAPKHVAPQHVAPPGPHGAAYASPVQHGGKGMVPGGGALVRPPPAGKGKPVEEDIHSKLLGL